MRQILKGLLCVLGALVLLACSRSDPQAALDKTVTQLQEALEAKNTTAVLALLHPDFYAQQPGDNREWARRTMMATFLRYKNVQVIARTTRNVLYSQHPDTAHIEAEVMFTGAEEWIPDNARHYQVTMQWRLVKGEWKLRLLVWE